ncbi:DUF551 domain-containing protein [Faecalicatena sp. Marseille-Q4148]|nr:DUF551 domain-containing protein [Faecalicatena sp. Marseille-Q4148]
MNVLEKILQEIKELKRKQNNQNQDYRTGYFSALSTVEGVIAGLNDGWIPVEERLPKENNKLRYDMQLVTLEDGEVCLGVYNNQENAWWTRRQEGEEWYTNKRNVVAWQPLPEAYHPKQEPVAEHIMSRFTRVE